MRDTDEPPAPVLRHDIMDLFDSPPEPLDHQSYVVDYMGIPLLIAPLPTDDSADLGVERPLPLYAEHDPSPCAVLHRVARRMLKSMFMRRPAANQLEEDARVSSDFHRPEILRNANDFPHGWKRSATQS